MLCCSEFGDSKNLQSGLRVKGFCFSACHHVSWSLTVVTHSCSVVILPCYCKNQLWSKIMPGAGAKHSIRSFVQTMQFLFFIDEHFALCIQQTIEHKMQPQKLTKATIILKKVLGHFCGCNKHKYKR